MRRLTIAEGAPLDLSTSDLELFKQAVTRLNTTLKPRPQFTIRETDRQTAVHGFIGTVQLSDGTLLDVQPKVAVDDGWIAAVLELLVDQPLEIAGRRRAGTTPNRPELMEALAEQYRGRLREAINRDGPIATLVRRKTTTSRFKGRLAVSEYVRHAWLQPHRYPVSFDQLSTDNPFSRVLTLAAHALSNGVRNPRLQSELRVLAQELRPGAPPDVLLRREDVIRTLPSQWSIYEPAWSIAQAVLSRAQLLGASGRRVGLEIVIEAWPLLERLLKRSLEAYARDANNSGRDVTAKAPASHLLLDPESSPSGPKLGAPKDVRADGLLTENGQVVATFEAKYSRGPDSVDDWPGRHDRFQALATAAAFSSPVAVLVYPGSFPTRIWSAQGIGPPQKLIAVGLDLYSYRRGTGDVRCAKIFSDGLGQAASLASHSAAAAPHSA